MKQIFITCLVVGFTSTTAVGVCVSNGGGWMNDEHGKRQFSQSYARSIVVLFRWSRSKHLAEISWRARLQPTDGSGFLKPVWCLVLIWGAASFYSRSRNDVQTCTPWKAPIIWDGMFDPDLYDRMHQQEGSSVALTVFAIGRLVSLSLFHTTFQLTSFPIDLFTIVGRKLLKKIINNLLN